LGISPIGFDYTDYAMVKPIIRKFPITDNAGADYLNSRPMNNCFADLFKIGAVIFSIGKIPS